MLRFWFFNCLGRRWKYGVSPTCLSDSICIIYNVYVYYTCMYCAHFGFNILIAWAGDGPWKDRLSPTCHRDSLPMASDQGIGLQAHLRLKCYPLRFVFVFLLQCLYIMWFIYIPVNDYGAFSLWFYISIFRDCVMNFNVVNGEKNKRTLIYHKARTDNYEQLFLKIKLKLFTCIVLL